MSVFAMVLLILASESSSVPSGCEATSPVRDPQICEPLYSEGEFTIYSMESVAVGSHAEMSRIRKMTQHCGLSNRIDGVGSVDLAVYDIFDATEVSRACVRDWIAENVPELSFSEEQLDEKFESAPPLEESEPS